MTDYVKYQSEKSNVSVINRGASVDTIQAFDSCYVSYVCTIKLTLYMDEGSTVMFLNHQQDFLVAAHYHSQVFQNLQREETD